MIRIFILVFLSFVLPIYVANGCADVYIYKIVNKCGATTIT